MMSSHRGVVVLEANGMWDIGISLAIMAVGTWAAWPDMKDWIDHE